MVHIHNLMLHTRGIPEDTHYYQTFAGPRIKVYVLQELSAPSASPLLLISQISVHVSWHRLYLLLSPHFHKQPSKHVHLYSRKARLQRTARARAIKQVFSIFWLKHLLHSTPKFRLAWGFYKFVCKISSLAGRITKGW